MAHRTEMDIQGNRMQADGAGEGAAQEVMQVRQLVPWPFYRG